MTICATQAAPQTPAAALLAAHVARAAELRLQLELIVLRSLAAETISRASAHNHKEST